ncbi:ATP-binding protein [Streptomyces bobili]
MWHASCIQAAATPAMATFSVATALWGWHMERYTKRHPVGRSGAALTPVRGRDDELAFIGARLDALSRGHGGIVCVEGAPGSGKTRLLAEGHSAAARRGSV